MGSCLLKIENGYVKTPYHNNIHAADVIQAGFYYLNDDFVQPKIDTFNQFCFLFGCAIHDYQHPGTDNAFEIESRSKLALLYNDRAVLENYHVFTALELLKKEELNPFGTWEKERVILFRKTVISLVLSTDFSIHERILRNFSTEIVEQQDDWDISKINTLLSMLIHSSDISNPSRPTNIALEWSIRYTEEQFLIGDKRKSLGLPVGIFMDRNKPNIGKNQIGFINFVILPTYTLLNKVLSTANNAKINIETNLEFWSNYNGIYSPFSIEPPPKLQQQ